MRVSVRKTKSNFRIVFAVRRGSAIMVGQRSMQEQQRSALFTEPVGN